MKLSDYAKRLGISYKTAWRLYKQGHIKGYQLPTGTIIVEEDNQNFKKDRCIIYARVLSLDTQKDKEKLEKQVEKLQAYANSKNYKIVDIVKTTGSVFNNNEELKKVLERDDYDILLIENKNILVGCYFDYINLLLKKLGKKIEIAHPNKESKKELILEYETEILKLISSKKKPSKEWKE